MSRIVSGIVSCENKIHQFFLNSKIGSLLKRSNINKEKGISPVAVFRVVFTLVFAGKNLYRTIGWSHCVRTLTVAPTERGVAGKASARQPMSLWKWWPRPLQVGSKPSIFCSTAGLPIP
jgi:hypothetical protein